jgi:hypothetical protein
LLLQFLIEDNEGNLWLVTYNTGVWKFNGKELINYPVKDGETDVLLLQSLKTTKEIFGLEVIMQAFISSIESHLINFLNKKINEN